MTKNKPAWNKRVSGAVEKCFIDEYLTGSTSTNIAKRYGFKTAKTVLDVLVKHGVQRRAPKIQTHYNETFFDNINTHEKAYFLGLMATDGYIVKDYAGFGIQLTEGDADILRQFSKLLWMTNPLCHIDYSKRRLSMPGSKDCIRLEIKNRRLAQGLMCHGIVRHKTKIIRFNKKWVSDEFLPSFFRGLWDGDGNMTITHKPSPRFECALFSASLLFVRDLVSALKGEFVATFRETTPARQATTPHYLLRISGGYKAGKSFANWIYGAPTTLKIERKYARVKDCLC